jgi:hypothetical protein
MSVGGSIIFTLILAVIFICSLSGPVISASQAPNNGEATIFSLKAENKPLGKVVAEIAEKTKYKIFLQESYRDIPITIELKKVSLFDGLDRILKNYNKTLTVDDRKQQVVIQIYPKDSQNYGKSSTVGVYNPDTTQGPEDVGNDNVQLEAPREKGITRRELEEIRVQAPPSNPMDDEVVPGVTRRELEKLKTRQESSNPMDDEVVPGVTRRELERMKAGHPATDPLGEEIVPPDTM